jgi:transcription elongation factor Elf1
MPIDHFGESGDDNKEDAGTGPRSVFKDFDCPLCNANNPYDDGFASGDEVRCFYCGAEFTVRVDDNGKLRLREA